MADTAVEPSAEPGPTNPGVVRSDLFTKEELQGICEELRDMVVTYMPKRINVQAKLAMQIIPTI